MDAIHYKVREDGRIINRAAYVVLGVTLDGTKDILSITIGANESSKFGLGMLNDLKNRGGQDVLFFCVDGLTGFKEAIHAVFPNAEVQHCIIHMLRNSFKYVSYKDLKKFSSGNDMELEKMLYLASQNVIKKWTQRYRNWDLVLSQLSILYSERLNQYL